MRKSLEKITRFEELDEYIKSNFKQGSIACNYESYFNALNKEMYKTNFGFKDYIEYLNLYKKLDQKYLRFMPTSARDYVKKQMLKYLLQNSNISLENIVNQSLSHVEEKNIKNYFFQSTTKQESYLPFNNIPKSLNYSSILNSEFVCETLILSTLGMIFIGKSLLKKTKALFSNIIIIKEKKLHKYDQMRKKIGKKSKLDSLIDEL